MGYPDRKQSDAAAGPAQERTLSGEFHSPAPVLEPGRVLARRYQIVELLGQGGMGAVYKAQDRELERLVALKVIRPELAANASILQRFKQELILARKITHKNVVRIYDLGEAAGLKFITMEYVDGEDLRSLLRRRGKLPPEEAVGIFQQVCRALDAAHGEGVIHRDLKPGNVMRDAQGRVVVMDFGLARSLEESGLTQTGALVGTLEYMAPEQAMGQPVDAASDVYSAGLILYELLIGRSAFPAESGVASLVRRTRERPAAPTVADRTISAALSEVVTRCLEPDPQKRFRTAAEVLATLESSSAPEARSLAASFPGVLPPIRRRVGTPAVLAAGILVAVAMLVSAMLVKSKWQAKPVTHAPVSVLVADFANQTGDSVFDGTLEPALTIALEGAPFISSYNRGQAHKLASQLQPGAANLDLRLARLVATREGISVVISGAVARDGGNYRVAVEAEDAVTGKAFSKAERTAAKDDVLGAMGKLAASVRRALGDTTPESAQLAAAETFTAGSLEAAHEYAAGQESLWAGKNDDAIQHYLQAIKLDENFGRAYSGLAAIYNNFGRQQEAEQYYKLALSKIDRMSEREKYRTRGAYYAVILRDSDKAIEELQQLVSKYPSDSAGFANLALAYFYKRDMVRALEQGRHAVELSPNNVLQRNNVGLYAVYAGDFEAGAREQQRVLELNPKFEMGYVGMAMAQMGSGRADDAAETYRKLSQVSARGASRAVFGLADIALEQGDAAGAITLLERGIEADLKDKNNDAAAIKLVTLAQARLTTGPTQVALADLTRALADSQDDSILYWSARTYLQAGKVANARSLASQLQKRLSADSQSYGRLIEGEALLHEQKAQEALKSFQEAKKISDTWMGRMDSALAYLQLGVFAEAYSELETCLKRRGEAAAVFLDDVPSFRVLPSVYYYLGRAQEGLNSPAAVESFKSFVAMRSKAAGDPLIADARRRMAAH